MKIKLSKYDKQFVNNFDKNRIIICELVGDPLYYRATNYYDIKFAADKILDLFRDGLKHYPKPSTPITMKDYLKIITEIPDSRKALDNLKFEQESEYYEWQENEEIIQALDDLERDSVALLFYLKDHNFIDFRFEYLEAGDYMSLVIGGKV